jgi:hypothetical protein
MGKSLTGWASGSNLAQLGAELTETQSLPNLSAFYAGLAAVRKGLDEKGRALSKVA